MLDEDRKQQDKDSRLKASNTDYGLLKMDDNGVVKGSDGWMDPMDDHTQNWKGDVILWQNKILLEFALITWMTYIGFWPLIGLFLNEDFWKMACVETWD